MLLIRHGFYMKYADVLGYNKSEIFVQTQDISCPDLASATLRSRYLTVKKLKRKIILTVIENVSAKILFLRRIRL